MPAITENAPTKLLKGFEKLPGTAKFRMFLRTARQRFSPSPAAKAFEPVIRSRQDTLLSEGRGGLHQRATILRFPGRGRAPVPTVIIGGFVPDATESIFLLKEQLVQQGDVYCLNYPLSGFSTDLFLAQLDDLVEELSVLHGREPVIFSVSFGAGLALEWLRRRRVSGGQHPIRGLVLISPVACVEDLIPGGGAKPATLLGRAIQPFLGKENTDEKAVERSRTIFGKMFESGAQNKEALAGIMTGAELRQLKERVLGTIKNIDFLGACQRVTALKTMHSPRSYFQPGILPLAEIPTLVLYAEKEDSVLDDASPTRSAMLHSILAYFPRGRCLQVRNRGGSPVQHASLIFHYANFRPLIGAFYSGLRKGRLGREAA